MSGRTVTTPRAARHDARAYFDFNVADRVPTPAEAAAAWAGRDLTGALFAQLEAADDMLTNDRGTPRAAMLEALRAVIAFAHSSPHGGEGRFSRPLELLAEDIESLPAAQRGEVFPPIKGAPSRRLVRRVQGSAAYAYSVIRGDGSYDAPSQEDAAASISRLLSERRFPFTAGAVVSWSKGSMAQLAVAELDRLRASPPAIDTTGTAEQRQGAALAWLGGVLETAGWG